MNIVGITSCTCGIAHTYMAAEALEKAAAAAGCRIKVETRGSGGAKNVLTDAEIASAKAVIVAADTKVPMDRFDGKALIECKVADGISKAAELVDRAMRGDAKAYHARTAKKESKGRDRKDRQRRTSDLYTSDEWGIAHASVRYRWRYLNSDRLFDRYFDGYVRSVAEVSVPAHRYPHSLNM